MSLLLDVLHGVATLIGVAAWILVGLWLGRTALAEGRLDYAWQAAVVGALWPLLLFVCILQWTWDKLWEAVT